MQCKICANESQYIFDAKILNKYHITYYHCHHCGFLQTEEPYWLDEAYSESINVSDTGYMQRNLALSKKLTILLSYFNKDALYLDYAGGYGVFVRLMRDVGYDFIWDDKYTKNLFAQGFEYKNDETIEAITTFESFEHFVNPLEDIQNMLKVSKNIIFTTELLPNSIPAPNEWWYYGLEHGQHISFYSKETLEYIANKYSLNYFFLDGLHVITEKKIPSYISILLKSTRFCIDKLYARKLKSKTWDDYLRVSSLNENYI